ncbi:GNAT family N-acetyltransferase [Chloroflexi bacterium TSY]|nr:GNAT family N-acetyltransferase [Chloroflexi bacterium TSY]
MKIAYLADYPEYIPTLAQWHQGMWGHLDPKKSVETRIRFLSSHGRRQIPTTFVAIENDQPLGSTSLVVSDLSTRPELTPWLASVFTAPEHRNRGIGSVLVQRVMDEARSLSVETLYLITPDKQNFYARLGWTRIEEVEYRGEVDTLMSIGLGSS